MKDRSTNDKNEEPAAMKPEAPLRAAAFGEEYPENAEGGGAPGSVRFQLGRFVAEL